MEIITESTNDFDHTSVLYKGVERLVHRFVDCGSEVEIAIADTENSVFAIGTKYTIQHDENVSRSTVLKHIGLERFLEPDLVA